jgi:hypothetical protein
MTTFDDRQRAFEDKFKHDQDLQFRVVNRRNKLMGLWAASELGKSGDAATAYAKEVVLADFEVPGPDDVVRKIVQDFKAAGVDISEHRIRKHLEDLMAVAKEQVMKE